ncbi:MAG: hypothetical protein AABZ80_09295 [Gemmatimonadota bacterium]
MRVALLAAAALVGGCGLWYRPVPVPSAIGKERTAVAGDSFSVHRDPRFAIYGPGTQAVFDAYEQLNRTYRAFDRYFAAPSPRLAIVLYPEWSKPRDAAERALREQGTVVLRFVRPMRASFRERVGEDGYDGSLWPVGPTAVRLLLASIATPTAAIDTATLIHVPAWYRSAVMSIVGDGTALPYDVQFVREGRTGRGMLEELLATQRPTAADSALDPYRRDDADDEDRRFAARSSAFMQFLLDREGPEAMGSLGRGFTKGESLAQQAARFKVLPTTMVELEERWLAWLSAQRPTW